MNNMKTGNMLLDTVICLMIPFVFAGLLKVIDNLRLWWDTSGHLIINRYISKSQVQHHLIISHRGGPFKLNVAILRNFDGRLFTSG
jgi:hypothetical protein